jgi:5'-phosphate synthase pdxT subunit
MDNAGKFGGVTGLLAIQGAYFAHRRMFDRLGMKTALVRYPGELDEVDGIVVPGGESTTMLRILADGGFREKLIERVGAGLPYFGTCAGAILAAKEVANPEQESLGLIDISVRRNAYGRQVDSFVAAFPIPGLGIDAFHGVFIRAPIISRLAEGVEVLAEYGGHPVLIRQGNMLLATFHPELSESGAVHEYFAGMMGG